MEAYGAEESFALAEIPDLVRRRSLFYGGSADRYLELDSALCRYFFSADKAGFPVYLDVEEEELEACGRTVGLSGREFHEALLREVRGLLVFGQQGVSVLREFERANLLWRKRLSEVRRDKGARLLPPPLVGLLAVFVIPAEQMGSEGGKGGSHQKYYPRLEELLSIPQDERSRFIKNFREVSEEFWQSLNLWLEFEDGTFGLPTAYSLSHRYVGLPVSQALIRETERRQLRRFFAQSGLSPADQITAGEMQDLLDEWVGRSDSPATRQLKKLWSEPGSREQVSEIAVTELHSWDGFGFDEFRQGGRTFVGSTQCFIYLSDRRESLFRSSIGIGVFAKAGPEILNEEATLRATNHLVAMAPFALRDGLVGFGTGPVALDEISLMEGELDLQVGEVQRRRLPRNFVPFEFDPIANIWVEAISMEIGGQYRCLALRRELDTFVTILNQMAAEGYELADKPGVPEGWALLENVTVVEAAPEELLQTQNFHLSAFQARASNKISLIDGMRLPGRVARYSSWKIPKASVTHDQIEKSSILIRRLDLERAEEEARTDYQPAPYIIDLANLIDSDGDYELLLLEGKEDGKAVPISRVTLRLRSAEEPDPIGWSNFHDCAHIEQDPMWVMRSSMPDETSTLLNSGAMSFGPECAVTRQATTLATGIEAEEIAIEAEATVSVTPLDPESCVLTARHRWRLPLFDGKYQKGFMTQTCEWCGLQQKVPANAKLAAHIANRRRNARAHRTTTSHAANPRGPASGVALDSKPVSVRGAEDAVFYLGSGTISQLNQIAYQVEPSALFANTFMRNMEQLGAIEVVRGSDLSAISFEVAPTVAGTVSTGEIVLFGSWLPPHRREVEELGVSLGVEVSEYERQGHVLTQLEDFDLETLRTHLGDDYEYLERPGLELVRRLPALSNAAEGLVRVPFAATPDLQKFNIDAGKWESGTLSSQSPGAYLTGRHARQYMLRNQADLENGQIALADPYISKHVAALQVGRRLIEFDSMNSQLRVPLGCDLPGLYARAAVLEGGLLPMVDRGTLVYEAISDEFAEILLDKLSV